MEVHLKNSTGALEITASILSAVVSFLLVLSPGSYVVSILSVLVSPLLFLFPCTLVPAVFVSSISSSISIFGFSALFYFLFLFILSNIIVRKNFKLHVPKRKYVAFLVVLLAWMIFCASRSLSGNLYDTLKLCFTIVLFALCAFLDKSSWKPLIEELDILALFFSPVVLLKLLLDPCKFIIEGTSGVKILNTISESLNPNQFALAIAVLFVLEFTMLLKKRDLFHAFSLACLFSILLILKSRTSFFSALLVSGIYAMHECGMSKKVKSIICFLVSIVAVLIIVRAVGSAGDKVDTTDAGKSMSLSSIIQSNGSGRFLTWTFALTEIVPKHFATGIGIGIANYESYGYERDADNLYVDLVTETGVAGILLFFLFYLSLISELKKRILPSGSETAFFVYILYLMLLCGIGETLFDSSFLWMIVYLCLVCARSRGKNPEFKSV